MESSLDANNSEGQFKVTIGHSHGQMAYHCSMDMELGGWSHLRMLKIMTVSSRSPRVTQRQMANHCMNMKLGGWSHLGCQHGIFTSTGLTTIVVWTRNLVDGVILGCYMLTILKVS